VKTELLLLAAGQSKRFGGVKQLADIHGQPMICYCLSQYRQGVKWIDGISQGHAVLGSSAELVSAVLPNHVDKLVVSTWQQGMGHSLAEGMQILASDTTHVLIALADQVCITQEMVMDMLDRSINYPNLIIAAKYAGGLGAPVIFPKLYFPQLRQLSGDKGAKALLQSNLQKVISVELPSAVIDIDTLADLKLLNSNWGSKL
jgi:molybdenum cofactor cytidylyltransferase